MEGGGGDIPHKIPSVQKFRFKLKYIYTTYTNDELRKNKPNF